MGEKGVEQQGLGGSVGSIGGAGAAGLDASRLPHGGALSPQEGGEVPPAPSGGSAPSDDGAEEFAKDLIDPLGVRRLF